MKTASLRWAAWLPILSAGFISPAGASGEKDLEEFRRHVRKSHETLEEIKASREKVEKAQTMKELDSERQEISVQTEQLNRTLAALAPQGPEEEICFASIQGDLETVQRLLKSGVSPDARDRFGGSALEGAADGGFTEIVQVLIRKGADVNARGPLGGTPLILAAANGHLETVRGLLEAGADPTVKAQTGVTALVSARSRGHKEVVLLLQKAGVRE